jgi:hypothetical protein
MERGIEVVFVLPADPPVRPPLRQAGGRDHRHRDGLRGRSVILVRSSDALAALGGESGTMVEVLLAYSMGIPAVVLRSGLPSDSLERIAEGGRLDSRAGPGIAFADSPEELAARSLEVAADWARRGR